MHHRGASLIVAVAQNVFLPQLGRLKPALRATLSDLIRAETAAAQMGPRERGGPQDVQNGA